jgi:hypothetical protein
MVLHLKALRQEALLKEVAAEKLAAAFREGG